MQYPLPANLLPGQSHTVLSLTFTFQVGNELFPPYHVLAIFQSCLTSTLPVLQSRHLPSDRLPSNSVSFLLPPLQRQDNPPGCWQPLITLRKQTHQSGCTSAVPSSDINGPFLFKGFDNSASHTTFHVSRPCSIIRLISAMWLDKRPCLCVAPGNK